jgi:lipopolysaccharide/colanic/teichoic acid biosynthesis glycosyltransferase
MRKFFTLTVDLLLVAFATLGAFVLREDLDPRLDHLLLFLPYLIASLAAASVALPAFMLHRSVWRFSGMPEYVRMAQVSVLTVIGAVAIGFAYNRLDGVARSLPIAQLFFIVTGFVGARVLYRLHRARRTGNVQVEISAPVQGEETVLIAGLNPVTTLFLGCVSSFASNRIKVCGIVSEKRSAEAGRVAHGLPVLGSVSDLDAILASLEVHGVTVQRIVVTADPHALDTEQNEVLQAIEARTGIVIDYFAERLDFVERIKSPTAAVMLAQTGAQSSDSERMISRLDAVSRSSERPFWLYKRALDTLLAAILLLVLAVPMIAVGVVGLIVLGAPIMFWQNRPGINGRWFKVHKLRTLHPAHDSNGRRVSDADRQSMFGAFLRMTRIDELPQLVCILRGDMSFIGPRPLLLSEQGNCPTARLLVRPGLTGWAQVNGGRSISIEDKTALDLWYIEHASFKLDALIAFRTAQMLIRGEQRNTVAIDTATGRFALEATVRNRVTVPHSAGPVGSTQRSQTPL